MLVNNISIIFLGPENTGKTSVVNRILKDKFVKKSMMVHEEAHALSFGFSGNHAFFEILDVGTLDRLFQMRQEAGGSGDVIVLMYSTNDEASFEEISQIRQEVLERKGQKSVPPQIVVVANKVDLLETEEQLNRLKVQEMVVCVDWNHTFITASAKDNLNIQTLTNHLAVIVDKTAEVGLPQRAFIQALNAHKAVRKVPTFSKMRKVSLPSLFRKQSSLDTDARLHQNKSSENVFSSSPFEVKGIKKMEAGFIRKRNAEVYKESRKISENLQSKSHDEERKRVYKKSRSLDKEIMTASRPEDEFSPFLKYVPLKKVSLSVEVSLKKNEKPREEKSDEGMNKDDVKPSSSGQGVGRRYNRRNGVAGMGPMKNEVLQGVEFWEKYRKPSWCRFLKQDAVDYDDEDDVQHGGGKGDGDMVFNIGVVEEEKLVEKISERDHFRRKCSNSRDMSSVPDEACKTTGHGRESGNLGLVQGPNEINISAGIHGGNINIDVALTSGEKWRLHLTEETPRDVTKCNGAKESRLRSTSIPLSTYIPAKIVQPKRRISTCFN